MTRRRDSLQKGPASGWLPTNLTGVYSAPPFPQGFNPVTATWGDLDHYGFPLRPSDRAALGVWRRVFARPLQRHLVPVLELKQKLILPFGLRAGEQREARPPSATPGPATDHRPEHLWLERLSPHKRWSLSGRQRNVDGSYGLPAAALGFGSRLTQRHLGFFVMGRH
jgi:hypothetical protein